MAIDSHCHWAAQEWEEDRHIFFQRLKDSQAAGVTRYLQAGINPADWDRQLKLKSLIPGLVPVFGIHPWEAARTPSQSIEQWLNELESRLATTPVLGEIGLDFHPRFRGSEDRQLQLLEAQLTLAVRHQKPIIVHSVRAHHQIIPLLRQYPRSALPFQGIVHAFSDGPQLAEQYWELGYLIGLGAPLLRTAPIYEKLRKTVIAAQGRGFCLETDSPYQLASPALLVEVAKVVADSWQTTSDQVMALSDHHILTMIGEYPHGRPRLPTEPGS